MRSPAFADPGGVIVFDTSVHQIVPKPQYVGYACSKAAIGDLHPLILSESYQHPLRILSTLYQHPISILSALYQNHI